MSIRIKQTPLLQKGKTEKDYFVLARDWCDDMIVQNVLEKKRWRFLCLFILLPICVSLCVFLFCLLERPRYLPMLIHHYENGRVFVTPIQQKYQMPKHRAQMESEVVRYVINRESYNAMTYKKQYELVHLLSSDNVAKQYRRFQSAKHPDAFVNVFGKQGQRLVRVESVLLLRDGLGAHAHADPHQPYLAKVDFVVRDYDAKGVSMGQHALTVLIAWRYRKMSDAIESLWENWDGFTVVAYQVQQRRMGKFHA